MSIRRISTAIILIGLPWAPVGKGQVQETPPEHPAGESAERVSRSGHFELHHRLSDAQVPEMSDRLESVYAAVVGLLRSMGVKPADEVKGLEVHVASSEPEFRGILQQWGISKELEVGGYDRAGNRVVLVDPWAVARGMKNWFDKEEVAEAFARVVVHHEIAHQVTANMGLFKLGSRWPKWLEEGWAGLFETALPWADASKPPVNEFRLLDWVGVMRCGELGENGVTVDAALREIRAGKLISWRDLVRDDAAFSAGNRANFAYSASWGLVRYLVVHHPDAFAAYMSAVDVEMDGDERLAQFRRVFGVTDDEAFERAWVSMMVADSALVRQEDWE